MLPPVCPNCGHATIPNGERMFAEQARRLLLKIVSMLEDHYGLRRINPGRGERVRTTSR
jgi:hypothetical protein